MLRNAELKFWLGEFHRLMVKVHLVYVSVLSECISFQFSFSVCLFRAIRRGRVTAKYRQYQCWLHMRKGHQL